MKHFILLEKDYVINPIFKNPVKRRPRAVSLYSLSRIRRNKGSWKTSAKSRRPDRRQKCIVKTHYSKSLSAHKYQVTTYLTKEGAGKGNTVPELYGTPKDEYVKNMVRKNYRIFISPASSQVPLKALAAAFIKKLELHTGRRLYTLIAEHYDTAHPHIHILVNGRDKNGQDIFFPPDLIKTFMRETARTICTSLIGPRTKGDLEREKRERITSNRYTPLDASLAAYIKENAVRLEKMKKNKETYVSRLDHLCALGICRWKKDTYVLDSGWDKTLKAIGRYNMFLNARRHVRYTPELKVMVYESSMGLKQGIITRVYKTDDVSDNHAVLLEAIDGNAYFIPLFYKPKAGTGDIVAVAPKKNEKGRLSAVLYPVEEADCYKTVIKNGYTAGYARILRTQHRERSS